MSSDAKWTRVAADSELAGPGPHAVNADGTDIVVVRTAGGLKAFEGLCPHQGALLGEGELDGGALVCRNHRWRFSLDTGKREGGPQCLRACPIREENGAVLVDASALTARSETRRAKRGPGDLPGPPPLPVVGNLLSLDTTQLHMTFEAWAREYGTPFTLKLGPKTVVAFSEMDDMLPVLRNRPDTFRRGSRIELVFEELGVTGVFSAEGKAWRPQRRLSMEALAHRHLRSFYPTLSAVAERLRKRWQRLAREGATLDLAEELKRFTVDVTTELAFGHSLNTIEQHGDDVIQRHLELMFPMFSQRIFAIFPWWHYVKLPSDRRADRALEELRAWFGNLIADARAKIAAEPERAERPRNFLEAMIVARDENGEPFSERIILGNAFTMLLAGEDTTAYTLAWAVHHLVDAPRDVAALRRELDATLGSAVVPRSAEIADGLAYATAIANETMRVRPVAPLLLLDAIVDTRVGDIDIPAGTTVALLLRKPAVDAAHFGDPHVFRPARWVDASATGGVHDPNALQPFGSGPRICPGRSLAMLEMRVVLSMLYKSFDVERVGVRDDVREAFAFTMMPTRLRVRLRERDHSATVTA